MEKLPTLNSFGRTPASSPALLTYERYYGLREKPFSLSTDPKFLYKSSTHSGTFDDLLLAIRRREGLIVLTGDIGTGKTTLCKAVLERLDRKTFTTFVPDPFVTREALLKMLLLDFGVMSVDDLKNGRMTVTSHPDLSYPLYEFLKSLVPLQAFAVLIIDEAQNLSSSLLEEIRILSDLESPEKLLQVVLVGQLELRAKLKLPEMRQLDQRVSARCSLEPLSRDGVSGYIAHRLDMAGGAHDRVHFTQDAIDAVFRASGGVPRLVNLICDRALHRGHLARKSAIDLEAAAQAVEDLGVGALTPAPEFDAAPDNRSAVPLVVVPEPMPTPPSAIAAPASSVTADLSGLEVHDIDDSGETPAAISAPIHSPMPMSEHRQPRRPLRRRVMHWIATATGVFGIVFVALFGQAAFINYFPPLDEQDLRLPGTPAPPRVPAGNTPIPIPADITQHLPVEEWPVDRTAAAFVRR